MPTKTIPILPCPSIDETLAFYEALGFTVTLRQERPNTYAVVEHGDIELHFFVQKPHEHRGYYTCYVLVDDVDDLYAAFTAGLRARYGRLPTRGLPRIGSLRDMAYGVRQFIVTDPAANQVRIGQPITVVSAPRVEEAGRLERSLGAAIMLADSRDDPAAAAQVLDSAIAADEQAPAPVRAKALILRADVALRMDEPDRATELLAEARSVELDEADRDAIADDLARARDLAEVLGTS